MRPKWFILALLILAGMGGWRHAAARQPVRQSPHKVIAPSGSLDGRPGVTLWHDYGAFALYRVTDSAALASLPAEARQADAMDSIQFSAYTFDTQRDTLNLPAALRVDAPQGGALHLVQFVGPVKQAWLDALRKTGVTPIHYIANNAYLVWADDAGRGKLNSMAADKDFVQYSAPYQPYFKLAPTIRQRILSPATNANETVAILLQVYPHPGWEDTGRLVKEISLAQDSDWTPVMDYLDIAIQVRAADLRRLALRPDVVWVEERLPRQRYDEIQDQLLAGNFNADQSGASGPGYLAFLDGFGFSHNPADYPIVDITDDGIGDGTINAGDPTLHQFGDIANPSRLAYVGNCTSNADGGGPDGHGHINTTIVGGYDTRGGFPFQDPNGFQRGMGVNPFGRMGGTRIFGGLYDISGCGGTDQGVILQSYTSGARISSNSWGCGTCAGTYDSSSQAYDAATRDADPAAPGNQQFLFVFAAGNDGPGSATVGSPGNGKNMITVGASENYRPSDEDGAWTDGCAVGPTGADNAMDVIDFSSRGPAPGGRIKPEIIAPGTHIQGAASTNPNYNGSGVCDMYRPSGQTTFAASSGTSHSTPAVAGVTSLYWYWLEHTYGLTSPSPALLKAYLLAHTTYLTGVDANDTLPSNNQGYGMPNLGMAFDSTTRYLLDQSVVLDNSGDTWTFDGTVVDPAKPLRVVLVYTDQAGNTGTSPQVNDLNLTVTVNGRTYLGNVFSGQWSTTGGAPDSANNYEAVFLPPGTGGALHITVTGFNIAGDGVPGYGDATDQDFALVCYNCARHRDFTLVAAPLAQAVCVPDDAAFDLQIGSVLNYTDTVTLSASGIPTGTTALFSANPVIPPGSSTLTVTNTGAAAYGTYTIDVIGIAPTSTHTATVQLTLFTAVPTATVPISPANNAMNVPIRPTLTWQAAAQGASYTLEVASDPAFTTLVYTATGITAASHTLGSDLNTSTRYYWRVRAANTCGASAYSPAFHFTTVPAPGDCAVTQNPRTLYSTDFESGASGWLHGALAGTDTWALSSTRTHSGSNAFNAADLGDIGDQWLTSPPLTLPLGQTPLTLQFWNYQKIENSSSGCYDGALLEVSSDGGLTWTQLPTSTLLTDPYDGLISTYFDNPLGGRYAWCGDPQDWLNSVVDLNAYAGQTVQFRFRLGSDSSFGREGWYIDDLRVQSCTTQGYDFTLQGDAQTSASPAVVTHTLVLQNLGNADAYSLTLTAGAWPASLVTASPLTVLTGTQAAIQVRVAVPDIAPALTMSDVFTLTAQSVHAPTRTHSVSGTTSAQITPGLTWNGGSTLSGDAGITLTHTFTLTNTGNHTDTFSLTTGGAAWSTTAPSSVGPLPPGGSITVPVQVVIPAAPVLQGKIIATDSFAMTATSQLDSSVYAATTGTTNALVHPAVQVGEASGGKTALPGGVVTYTVVITNSGDYTDTFDLALSGASWPIQVSATSVGPLKAGASAGVVVSVTIPTQPAALGDDFVLSAVSRLDARVKISLKRTTTADITPGVALAPVVAGATGYAGKAVTHTLTLTNTGTWTDTFGITLSGNVWQADVPLTLTLAAGAAAPLRVVVHIPANAADGAGDTLSVQVHSGYSSMVTASSQLTTTARNVRRLYLPVILR